MPEARALCVREYVPVIDAVAESASLRDAEFVCTHTSPHCANGADAPSLMWGYEEYVPSAHVASNENKCRIYTILTTPKVSTTLSTNCPIAASTASERLTLNNHTIAVGAVWGYREQGRGEGVPEARALKSSVFKEVLLAYSKSTLDEQSSVFFGKTDPLMVFFLSFDVVYYLVFIMDTIRKSSVFASPSSEIREQWVSLKPFAGKSLYSLYILCNRDGCWKRDKDMDMVGHPAYTVYSTMQILGLLHNDGIKLTFVFDEDGKLATIGAKHYMVEGLNVTHVDITQGSENYCDIAESASLRDAEIDWTCASPHCANGAGAPSLMWGYEEYVPLAHSVKTTLHHRSTAEGT